MVEALHLREGLVHRDGVRAGEDVLRSLWVDHGRSPGEESLGLLPGSHVEGRIQVSQDLRQVEVPSVVCVA